MAAKQLGAVVHFGTDVYCIEIQGDKSAEVEYGDPIIFSSGSKRYLALIDELGSGERVSLLGSGAVYIVELGTDVPCTFQVFDECAGESDEEDPEEESEDDDDYDGEEDSDDGEEDLEGEEGEDQEEES